MKPFLGKSILERYQWKKIPRMSNLILLGQHNSEKEQPDTFFFFFKFHFISDLPCPPLPHLCWKGLCSRLEHCHVQRDVICVMVTSSITSRQWDCIFTIDLHVGGSIYRNCLPTSDLLPWPFWTITGPYSAGGIAWCWARTCNSKM